MKKILLTIILLLIILAIGQGIYYKYNKTRKEINIPKEDNNSVEEVEKTIYAYGMLNLYEKFNPKLSLEELQIKMYNFVNIELPKLYADTHGKTIEEIKIYYNQNNINQYANIKSEEDFLMIIKQLQNIYHTQENIVLTETRIDTQSISANTNGLISFNVSLIFDNEKTLEIKIILSEQNKSFVILSNSNLDRIFENYEGDIKKEEILEKIDYFISKVNKIRENSTLKSKNEKIQYFDLNKEFMENLSVASSEDFIKVANQVNSMNWINGILTFQNYEINYENMEKDENYTNFRLILYYNYDSKINLIMSIRNNTNMESKIKLSGDDSVFQKK